MKKMDLADSFKKQLTFENKNWASDIQRELDYKKENQQIIVETNLRELNEMIEGLKMRLLLVREFAPNKSRQEYIWALAQKLMKLQINGLNILKQRI